jgi:periplasmic divalent cation tolerance protein
MEGFIQVTTTTETKADAERIALALVEARLAACVQIVGPIESIYRWKGRIESGMTTVQEPATFSACTRTS